MTGLLWAVLVFVLILWLLGFLVAHLGDIVHVLLVVALAILIYNLVTGRRRAV